MKTQQELMQAYWGPGGTVDMVKEYNAKHDCDVKPWECVRDNSRHPIVDHPEFKYSPNTYTFALTILYDDKHEEHRPVFADDKLYYKEDGSLITMGNGGIITNPDKWSWNPPTPERTFKLELNNDEFVYLQKITRLADSSLNRSIHAALTAARDKE